jgi:hypothetical protein
MKEELVYEKEMSANLQLQLQKTFAFPNKTNANKTNPSSLIPFYCSMHIC